MIVSDGDAYAAGEAEPRWRLVERLVAMLEKALMPEARVEHDVRLPNLRTGHPSQCDIVIRYGRPPRETMTIVEVQDRSSRVAINEFRGWLKKREDVGAQHLICVSALPFPQSIIDDVKLIGPTVRLVTLRELERNDWPEGLGMTYLNFAHARCTLDESKAPVLLFPAENPLGPSYLLPNREPLFIREGDSRARSFVDILDQHSPLTIENAMRPPGTYRETLEVRVDPPLYILHGRARHRVARFVIPFLLEQCHQKLPLICSSYVQEDVDGVLAWAVTSKGEFAGKRFEFRAVFVPTETGRFKLQSVAMLGGAGRSVCWYDGHAVEAETTQVTPSGPTPASSASVAPADLERVRVLSVAGVLLGEADLTSFPGIRDGGTGRGAMRALFIWPGGLFPQQQYRIRLTDGREIRIEPIEITWQLRDQVTDVTFVVLQPAT